MTTITLSSLLDDLRVADETLRKFEQRYWLGSDVFYGLYSQGMLDDGENLEDFAEWAGFFKIKQHREALLRQFSQDRVDRLKSNTAGAYVQIRPQEPVIEVAR
ncbi:MAG: hypothetical protein WA040_05185 [Anaerolineae bacterium]